MSGRTLTNREQVNEHTGERYFGKDVYVTNGAFIQAALEEGYVTKRVPRSGLSHLKTGEKWRGRPPGRCRQACRSATAL